MASKQPARQPVRPKEIDYAATDAADAAEEEATGTRQVFQLPLGDDEMLELVLPRKWKRFKFLRKMSQGDMWGAIETVGFSPAQLDRLEDAEVTEEEFEAAVKRLGETLTGKSSASERSGS
ncbi:hypothetical protein AB0I72_19170 [Nocardiopsis sp. NPDC049922]|uniref:hypothetical protein n=1 Tax=Nocardiopsis sp. NPDC049922 TaxID=3155157 RepID=UPI003408BCA8